MINWSWANTHLLLCEWHWKSFLMFPWCLIMKTTTCPWKEILTFKQLIWSWDTCSKTSIYIDIIPHHIVLLQILYGIYMESFLQLNRYGWSFSSLQILRNKHRPTQKTQAFVAASERWLHHCGHGCNLIYKAIWQIGNYPMWLLCTDTERIMCFISRLS